MQPELILTNWRLFPVGWHRGAKRQDGLAVYEVVTGAELQAQNTKVLPIPHFYYQTAFFGSRKLRYNTLIHREKLGWLMGLEPTTTGITISVTSS